MRDGSRVGVRASDGSSLGVLARRASWALALCALVAAGPAARAAEIVFADGRREEVREPRQDAQGRSANMLINMKPASSHAAKATTPRASDFCGRSGASPLGTVPNPDHS